MANPFVHVELHTQDPEKAKKFYKELFDWKLEDVPEMNYTIIQVGEGTGGGMMKSPMPMHCRNGCRMSWWTIWQHPPGKPNPSAPPPSPRPSQCPTWEVSACSWTRQARPSLSGSRKCRLKTLRAMRAG